MAASENGHHMQQGVFCWLSNRSFVCGRPYGLGAALQQQDLSRGINCPFDVLGSAVVTFDFEADFRQRFELLVANRGGLAKLFWRLYMLDPAAFSRHVLPTLVGNLPNRNLAGDFADHEAIGGNFAAYHSGAQAPACLDGD